MLRYTSFALLALTACFDFRAAIRSDVGGPCADGDEHVCREGLDCAEGYCIRENGSLEGEYCGGRAMCASELMCHAEVCVLPCSILACGDHGYCAIASDTPGCVCDDGYAVEGASCKPDRGSPCSETDACRSGLVCQLGRCAEQCNGSLCEGGTVCDLTQSPAICACPVGSELDESQRCVSLCSEVTCSGRGACVIVGGAATCDCNDGYVAQALSCVSPECIPASHASQRCESGDAYWVDSCGATEELAADCGARGCSGGSCNPIIWANRDLTFAGDAIRVADFAVAPNLQMFAAAATSAGLSFARWQGSWGEFAANNNTLSPGYSLQTVVLQSNASSQPSVAAGGGNTHIFARWNGLVWEGLGGSNTNGILPGAQHVSMALTSLGTPMLSCAAAYAGGGITTGIKVSRWDGTNWPLLNDDDLHSKTLSTPLDGEPAIALLSDTTPILVWTKSSTTAAVFEWNGAIWSQRGADIGATTKSLAIVANATTVATATVQGNDIAVNRWVSGAWSNENVSGGTEATPSQMPLLGLDGSGAPIVAWIEQLAAGPGILVKRYNGTAWVEIGTSTTGRGVVESGYAGSVSVPRLKVQGSTVCVGWNGNGQVLSIRCATL